jgi:hypothetical protein
MSTNISNSHSGLYRLGPSPLHGQGLFATRQIAPGTLVLRETPIATFSAMSPSPRQVWDAYKKTNEVEGFRWYSLVHTPNPENEAKLAQAAGCTRNKKHCGMIVAKAENNSFDDTLTRRNVLVNIGSRINHCCKSNVLWGLNAVNGEFEVRALTQIEPDEELVMSYIPQMFGRRYRRLRLGRLWGIKCKCVVCADKNSAHEKLMQEIFKVYVELFNLKAPADPVKQIELYSGRLELEKKDQCFTYEVLTT